MAVNDKQKIAQINNDANTVATIQGYLALGYVIISITNLSPFANKLLIVYTTPDVI